MLHSHAHAKYIGSELFVVRRISYPTGE